MLIVIPTYNERDSIRELLPRIRSTVRDADILVVDDNSPDGTAEVVRSARDSRIKVLSRAGKEGYGKAVAAGFTYGLARGYESIVQMDADGSHDPAFLPAIIDAARDADLVLGSRYVPGGGTVNWNWRRRLLSRMGNAYARTVLGLGLRDLTGGYRCWRRSLLEKLDLQSIEATGYSFMIESLHRAVQAGARIAEVPITFAERTQGRSKMSQRIISEAFFLVWKVRRKANKA